MQDATRIFPLTIRRNYKHRARITKALQELGVVDHLFPQDFFRRHWRDQQAYIEQILSLKFCTRCKIPVPYLDGAICGPCAESNHRSWTQTQTIKQRAADRSLADQPVIDEDIMERFQARVAETKVQRMAREYDITEDEARSILKEQMPSTERTLDVNAFLRKARGDKS